jgi:hypothetical protein
MSCQYFQKERVLFERIINTRLQQSRHSGQSKSTLTPDRTATQRTF